MKASTDCIAALASLTMVMDYHEKLGTTKNPLIVAEFIRLHEELLTTLEKENEARKRNQQPHGLNKDRAGVESNQPRSGEPLGQHGGPRYDAGTADRRTGAQGPDGE